MSKKISKFLFVATILAIAVPFGVFADETPVWPNYVPCTPENRCTIDNPIPVVNLLYKEDYNTLHSGEPKEYDLVTLGDSITCNWSVRDADGYYALSEKGTSGVLNLGIGGDRTEHLIWRLEEGGCLENFITKYFTLLIGTNNSFQNDPCDKPEEIALGIRRILYDLITKHPESKILLMPILPYGMTTDPRGSVRHANNEDVNDIIIKYVDNKRIFWLDLRGQMLNADGTFKAEMWSEGTVPGSDGVGHYLHPSSKAYKDVFDSAVAAAMKKYDAVPAGTAQETEPSLGIVTALLDGAKSEVTITLSGIYIGTDKAGVAARSYIVSYVVDGGDSVIAIRDVRIENSARNSFVIPNVAVGKHSCKILLTTAANKTISTTIEFTMCDPWTAKPLTVDNASIVTDGKPVYAYARGNYTVNGTPFSKLDSNENENMKWGIVAAFGSDHASPQGAEAGDYSSLLSKGWWLPSSTKECPLTLKNLTPGAKYIAQIVAYRPAYNDGKIWIDGTQKENTYIKAGGDGWPFGGTLVGTFTADETGTKSLVIKSDGGWALNAFQVRKLSEE